SMAIKALLDICHREGGPAVLTLGNTIKSAQHSRGSGIVEDRADMCFEVRDATGLEPTGGTPWWEELPPAGADAWAQRSSRRNRRDKYRLAFVPSKFRVGEEPIPFMFELDLSTEPWAIRDVTHEIEQQGDENRKKEQEKKQNATIGALEALASEVE